MKVDRCPTCRRRLTRSHPQNARYWLLLHKMSESIKAHGQTYSADTWHVWAKSKFLGCTDTVLPNKKVVSIPRSTASLDVAEFADYMTALEAWANERNCYLEDMAA